ncbi:MAG TPA: serine hydrolase [Caulobacteraceae bacterium]|jgi:CubicO group peptidase (beta-lactamase class C family)|nr:serine hydrolase [Caulobacteraceae bacterium]
MKRPLRTATALIGLVIGLGAVNGAAAGPAPASIPAPMQARVEAATDAAWAKIVAAHEAIPGAVVTVVGPDGLVFTKGYGVRDIRTQAPVDPNRTLFQVGSVTKLFTAVLALQAIDAGRLNADADLRGRYADLKITDRLKAPVTVRQLLAHQGGFDGDLGGVMTEKRDEALAFEPMRMKRHLRRVRVPGVIPAYDNTGVGLLGEVSARAFGLSYHDAMQKQVLGPIGMDGSSIGLPADREADAAACHRVEADGKITVCAHSYMHPGFQGAGALATTGADMAKYLQMMLDGGRGPKGQILSPKAFADYTNMDLNRFAPGVNGMGELLEEMTLADRPVLFHTGGYDGFSSGVYVMPRTHWAIFVSVEQYPGLPRYQNLDFIVDTLKRKPALDKSDGYKAVNDIASAVAELTPSAPPQTFSLPSTPLLPPAKVAGFYDAARAQSPSFFDDLVAGPLFGSTVVAQGPKAILVNGQPLDWLGGASYRARKTGKIVAFKPTSLGLAFSSDSSGAFIKVSGWRSPASAALFVLALIVFLVLAILAAACARKASRKTALIYLGVAACALIDVWLELQVYPQIWYGGAATAPIFLWRVLFQLALIAGLYALWRSGRALFNRTGERPGWLSATALVFASLGFIAFLIEAAGWGLVGRIAAF